MTESSIRQDTVQRESQMVRLRRQCRWRMDSGGQTERRDVGRGDGIRPLQLENAYWCVAESIPQG